MMSGVFKTHAVGGVLLAGVACAGAFFGVLPELDQKDVRRGLNDERGRLQGELDVARQQQREMRERMVALQDLGAGWAAQREDRVSLNQGMARLAAIGQERGVSIDALSAGDPVDSPLFVVTPIAVEGAGGYDACARFMTDVIERMPNVTIEQFDLSGGDGPGGGRFSMTLAWYSDHDG